MIPEGYADGVMSWCYICQNNTCICPAPAKTSPGGTTFLVRDGLPPSGPDLEQHVACPGCGQPTKYCVCMNKSYPEAKPSPTGDELAKEFLKRLGDANEKFAAEGRKILETFNTDPLGVKPKLPAMLTECWRCGQQVECKDTPVGPVMDAMHDCVNTLVRVVAELERRLKTLGGQ